MNRNLAVFVAGLVLAAYAAAQPGGGGRAHPDQMQEGGRADARQRQELRVLIRDQRGAAVAAQRPKDVALQSHQLSPQERHLLREQLRQQRRESRREP